MRVKKKNEEKKTLKIAILCIFAHGVLCTFLFWTILKLATQSLLICIIIKVEAKRTKIKILCMCAPDLKKNWSFVYAFYIYVYNKICSNQKIGQF